MAIVAGATGDRRRRGVRRRAATAAGRTDERARPRVERTPFARPVVAAGTGTEGRKAVVAIVAEGN